MHFNRVHFTQTHLVLENVEVEDSRDWKWSICGKSASPKVQFPFLHGRVLARISPVTVPHRRHPQPLSGFSIFALALWLITQSVATLTEQYLSLGTLSQLFPCFYQMFVHKIVFSYDSDLFNLWKRVLHLQLIILLLKNAFLFFKKKEEEKLKKSLNFSNLLLCLKLLIFVNKKLHICLKYLTDTENPSPRKYWHRVENNLLGWIALWLIQNWTPVVKKKYF